MCTISVVLPNSLVWLWDKKRKILVGVHARIHVRLNKRTWKEVDTVADAQGRK